MNAKCNDCGDTGHRSRMSKRCSKNPEKKDLAGVAGVAGLAASFATNNDDEPLVPFKDKAFMTSKQKSKRRSSVNSSDLRYVIDSGCTTSLSMNKASLKHYSTVLSEIQVAAATAPKLRCEGNGELDVTSGLSIKNVLYAPNVTLNLLSVAQIADLNCRVIFDKDCCKVEHIPTRRVLLTGKGKEISMSIHEQLMVMPS